MDQVQQISERPARVISLVFLCLGVLTLPPLLSGIVSLDWHLGNMRPVAWALTACFFILSIACWGASQTLNRRFRKAFTTNRKFLFALIGMGISCTFALVAMEISLRVLHFPFSGSWTPSENALAKFDDQLGWSYIPNNTLVQEFGSDATSIEMQFDERGIRVADRNVPLDPSAPSALFVGGSFTMGHGLEFEETFVGQLQTMPGFPLQVVNLGVQGFGTDQALLQLKRHIGTFDTKVVVYTFMYDHTRRNANHDRRLLFPEGRFLGTKPLFGIDSDGKPRLKKHARRYEDMTFIHLWGLVQGAWTHFGPKPTDEVTRALVAEMKELTEARGAHLVVIEWNQADAPTSHESAFADMPLHLIDTGVDPPDGWETWIIPGDTHPDKQASGHVARLVHEKLVQIGAIPASADVQESPLPDASPQ